MPFDYIHALSFVAKVGKLGPQPMLDLLTSLGGWPVLDPHWSDEGLNLEQLIADITLLGIDGIVTFEIGANQTMSSQSVLTVMLEKVIPRLRSIWHDLWPVDLIWKLLVTN